MTDASRILIHPPHCRLGNGPAVAGWATASCARSVIGIRGGAASTFGRVYSRSGGQSGTGGGVGPQVPASRSSSRLVATSGVHMGRVADLAGRLAPAATSRMKAGASLSEAQDTVPAHDGHLDRVGGADRPGPPIRRRPRTGSSPRRRAHRRRRLRQRPRQDRSGGPQGRTRDRRSGRTGRRGDVRGPSTSPLRRRVC